MIEQQIYWYTNIYILYTDILACTYVHKAMEVCKCVTPAGWQILYMHENLVFWLEASTWKFNEWGVGNALFRVTKELSEHLKGSYLQWALWKVNI